MLWNGSNLKGERLRDVETERLSIRAFRAKGTEIKMTVANAWHSVAFTVRKWSFKPSHVCFVFKCNFKGVNLPKEKKWHFIV